MNSFEPPQRGPVSPVSLYRSALGPDFERLQPELQDYFSGTPESGTRGEGTGIFEAAGCPRAWLRPLLALIPVPNAFFPDYGIGIPLASGTIPTGIRGAGRR
nr:DUF4166 domain-containing protein [Arthrobacter sp. ATA002]